MTSVATQADGIRVCIRIALQSIPGEAASRPFTLGDIFCRAQLKRPFDPIGDGYSFDDVHIPPGFDSENDVKRWFIYDLGVRERMDSLDYYKIRHECYRGCRLGDGSLKFVTYPAAQDMLVKRTNEFRWGHDESPDERLKQQQRHEALIGTQVQGVVTSV